MAKLNVEVLDMENGKVTKIAHEGEEYVSVDVKVPNPGDIAKVVQSWGTITKGDFYEVSKVVLNKFVYIDDWANGYLHYFEYFRKVQPVISEPTLEERVNELDGRVTALEAEADQVGQADEEAPDYLVGKFAKFKRDGFDVTGGKCYEIISVEDEDIVFIDDEGDEHSWTYPSEVYEIVDKFEEAPKFKVGDYVRITDKTHSDFGTIVMIVDTDYSEEFPYDTEHLDGEEGDCFNAEDIATVSVGEVEQAKLAQKMAELGRKEGEIKVGDIVEYNPYPGREYHGLKEYPGIKVEVIAVYGRHNIVLDKPTFVTSSTGTHTLLKEITLVTPVEHRLDVEKEDV